MISISLSEKDEQLLLDISDDGIGLTENQLTTKTETFGHSLIRAFRSKLDAEIIISSENGTQVSLIVKNYKKVL